MTDEDAPLVIALARGERSALTELYRRHAHGMAALARRILSSMREAEDIVHDVFVEAWEHAGDFDPARGSVRQWLLLRVRCRSLDRLRALGRRAPADGTDDAHRPSPETAMDARRARRALADLPPEQVQVLELSYFGGLSVGDIARELEIPVGTVKSRLAAGLSRLRASFQPAIEEAIP